MNATPEVPHGKAKLSNNTRVPRLAHTSAKTSPEVHDQLQSSTKLQSLDGTTGERASYRAKILAARSIVMPGHIAPKVPRTVQSGG